MPAHGHGIGRVSVFTSCENGVYGTAPVLYIRYELTSPGDAKKPTRSMPGRGIALVGGLLSEYVPARPKIRAGGYLNGDGAPAYVPVVVGVVVPWSWAA
jgi:hypothetical protein